MLPRRVTPHTVEVATGVIDTPDGVQPGTRERYRALIAEQARLVHTSEGKEVTSPVTVYMNPVEVEVGTNITIHPDTPLEATHVVVAKDIHRFPRRGAHTVLYLS